MSITYFDDKKEKWQSVEASLEDFDFGIEISNFLIGYGRNKDEAKLHLRNNVEKRIQLLKKKTEELELVFRSNFE